MDGSNKMMSGEAMINNKRTNCSTVVVEEHYCRKTTASTEYELFTASLTSNRREITIPDQYGHPSGRSTSVSPIHLSNLA